MFTKLTKIFHSSSTDHIIAGFPYVGSLKTINNDGSAKANVKINLCAKLLFDLETVRNHLTQNSFYSYDEDQILELAAKLNSIRLLQSFIENCSDFF